MMSNDEEPKVRTQASGRPTRKDIATKSKGGRNKVGRPKGDAEDKGINPKGDAAIINEYKARMLASPKSRRVMDTIFAAAMDDDHKNQAAAWKLVMDRILPVAAFEKDIVQNGGKSAIQINITGVGAAEITQPQESSVIDGESGEVL
jgi:hypothetical protein